MRYLIMTAMLLLSGSAFAEDGPSAAKLKEAIAADPNKPICVRETVTGSRLEGRKVCRTPRDWEEYRRNVRQEVEGAQRTSSQNSGGG